MAFDGVFLHKITAELSAAENSHVDKIYQPSKDELVFLLRKKGFVKKLLITARPGTKTRKLRLCFVCLCANTSLPHGC